MLYPNSKEEETCRKMDIMPLSVLFVVSWPEAVLVSWLGLQLVGIRPRVPYLVLAGLLQALSSYLVRALPIDYGFHTIIQVIVYAVILGLVLRIRYIPVQIAALIGFTCYLAVESAVLPLTVKFMGSSMESVLAQPALRVTAFIPQALIFLAAVVVIGKLNVFLLKIGTSPRSRVKNDEH